MFECASQPLPLLENAMSSIPLEKVSFFECASQPLPLLTNAVSSIPLESGEHFRVRESVVSALAECMLKHSAREGCADVG